MANFKTFGKTAAILISGGICITGILWFDRVNNFIRGEDYAYLVAATTERQDLWADESEDPPNFTTVHVNSFYSWDVIYNKILSGARTLGTNTTSTIDIEFIGWQYETITNSMNIASCESAWTNSTTVRGSPAYLSVEWDWETGSTTNIRDGVAVTAGLVDDADTILEPNISAPRMPVACALYGNYQVATNATLWNGSNNWWRVIGINDIVPYKYDCESWSYLYLQGTVTKLGGSSWSLNNASPLLAYGDSTDLKFAESDSDDHYYHAAAYKIESDEGDCYAAVYAGPEASPGNTQIIEFDRDTHTVTESGTMQTAFRVRTTIAPPGGSEAVFNFDVVNSTPGSIFSVEPSELYFSNLTYNVYQTVYVTTGIQSNGVDRAGIIKVGNNDYFALRINDLAGDTSKLSESPFFAESEQGETATISITVNITNDTQLTTSRFIRTNNLNQALTVLQGLDNTIAIIDFSELSVTNDVRVNYGGISNATDNGSATAYSKAEVPGIANSLLQTITSTNSIGDANEVWGINCAATVRGQESATDTSTRNISATMYFRDVYGCRLPYPSHWAITNGYINSYSVYGVYVCQHGARLRGGVNDTLDGLPQPESYTNLLSYTDDPTQPDYYESYLFGLCNSVRARPDITTGTDTVLQTQEAGNTNIYNSVFLTLDDYYDSANIYVTTPLTYIDTVYCTNAVSVPYFDIRTAYTNIQLSLSDYQQHNMEFERADGQYNIDQLKFHTSLAIQKFVIVVDWNWPYVGGTYTNEVYVPEWVITNTP